MPKEVPRETDQHSNAAMRRDMQRTSTAVGVVLLIVLVLALVTGLTGARATRNLQRAEAAEAASRDRLWHSYLAQARSTRLTVTAGRQQQALQVISNAAAIRTDGQLRTEAAAALALTDLHLDANTISLPKRSDAMEVDSARRQYASGDGQGRVHLGLLSETTHRVTLDGRAQGAGLRMPVQNVSFSPDNQLICVRHTGGTLALWDVDSHELIFTAGAETTNMVLAGMIFSPDSKRLYFSDPERNRQITELDIVQRQRIRSALPVGARMFRFRPNTSQVAIVKDNKVELFEYPKDTVLQVLELPTRVFVITWSPEGDQLAVSVESGDVHLWDLAQGTHQILQGHSEPCLRLGFSPDSRLLFTGSRDGTTRLWDAAQGLLLAVASEGMGQSFSADASRLGFVRFTSAIGSWRVEQSDCFTTLVCRAGDGMFTGMDLSPDGRWCVASQTKGLRLWDLNDAAREFFQPVNDLISVRFAPDGRSLFICRTNALERWSFNTTNPTNGELVFGPVETIALPDQQGARNIAISLDGTTAAVELTDLRFIAIDLAGQREPVIFPQRWRSVNQRGPASATGPGRFAISPDGRWIATGYWLGTKDTPIVWDARTGKMVATPAMGSSLSGFSPDGKWLALSGQGEFQIYSTADWQLVKSIERDEFSFTHGMLTFVGTNGPVAVTRTRQQIQLREWQSEDKLLDLIPISVQSVSSLRVSTDGNVLATGSARDVIQVWHLDRLRQKLAALDLDWGTPTRARPAPAVTPTTFWTDPANMLAFGFSGFLIVAVLSVLTLRRHRAAIARFFDAEAKARAQNRELEVAKVELMHSQKMQALGTLSAGIAHDFNNLLSVIRMSNKLIGREAKQNSDIQEHVADIEQAVLQGKGVVESMLGYARGDEGADEPTDICAVAENAVSLLSKEFLSGITLKLALDRNTPKVTLGRGQLEQVLLNLIVNASEAMQGKGTLKITVQERYAMPLRDFVLRPDNATTYVEMAVTDSGPGVPPDIRDRLFEPFFTTKRSGSKAGTGLGLSLVYAIAQQERLGLSVDSEPGKGATFALTIPVREMHSSQTPKTA